MAKTLPLGNNRSNGLNLGAASVNADNVWSNANGDNWSARETQSKRLCHCRTESRHSATRQKDRPTGAGSRETARESTRP